MSAMTKQTSALALATFVIALSGYFCLFPFPLAAILGLFALLRFRGPAGAELKGRWMAVSGFTLGAVNTLFLAGGIAYFLYKLPQIRCNHNLTEIAKARKKYKEEHGAENPSSLLDELVRSGSIEESTTRCPAADHGGRYVMLSDERVGQTGVIAYDAERYHHGERSVLHAEQEIGGSPPRFTSDGGGGVGYQYEYLVLWIADGLPEDRFQKILNQKSPERP